MKQFNQISNYAALLYVYFKLLYNKIYALIGICSLYFQLEEIKERARNFAELPDKDFELVLETYKQDCRETRDCKMSQSQQAFMTSIARASQGAQGKTAVKGVSQNGIKSAADTEGGSTPSTVKESLPMVLSNDSSSSSMEDGDSRSGTYWDYDHKSTSSDTAPRDKVTIHNKDKMPVKQDKVTVHQPYDLRHLEMTFNYFPDRDEPDDLQEVVVDPPSCVPPVKKRTQLEEKNRLSSQQNERSCDEVFHVEKSDYRRYFQTIQNQQTRQRNNQQYDESHDANESSSVTVRDLEQDAYKGHSRVYSKAQDTNPVASPRSQVYAGIGRSKPTSADNGITFFSSRSNIPCTSMGVSIKQDIYPINNPKERLLRSKDVPRYGSLEEGCARTMQQDEYFNLNMDDNHHDNDNAKKRRKKKKNGKGELSLFFIRNCV